MLQFDILDDSKIASRFVTVDDSTHATVTFTVPGMQCAGCVRTLERLDRLNRAIYRADVDLTRKTARILYNPQQTTLRSVAELLASLNFPPLLTPTTEVQDKPAHRALILRLGVAGFAAVNVMMFGIASYLAGEAGLPQSIETAFRVLSVLLSFPVLVFSASPWWMSAWGSIRNRTMSLDIPVSVGIAAIFIRSIVDISQGYGFGYLDSFTGLVFFLLIGRLVREKAFASISFDRSVKSFFPLGVKVVRDTDTITVPIDDLVAGDVMQLRNGEVLPCNAVLQSPTGCFDYAFVTGERDALECSAGTELMAGGKVVGASVRCLATSDVSHGHLTELWERTSARRPRTRLLEVSTRFGAVFTIITVLIAVTAFAWWLPNLASASSVLTAVLIIACPCAMTLAAPIALGTAMGLLGKRGIMVRNTGTLLELDRVSHVVFDKTGTLTTATDGASYAGAPLSALEIESVSAVVAESTHPISQALADTFTRSILRATDVRETIGGGIVARAGDHEVAVGSALWITQFIGEQPRRQASATYISIDGVLKGEITPGSTLRTGVPSMLASISLDYTTSLISGDGERDRELFSRFFSEEQMQFGVRPEEKVNIVSALQHDGACVLMVGDGLNDAAAMNTSNVAIAVGSDTTTAVPACDVIVPADSIAVIPSLLRFSHAVRRVIIATFIVSLAYNAVGLTLAVMGLLSPVAVAILMPVSSLTVIGMAVGGVRLAERASWK